MKQISVSMLEGCGSETCGLVGHAFLQEEHLEGELQRADMQQIGLCRWVWLQEVRR